MSEAGSAAVTALSIALALLAAFANAFASVLQRRAAADERADVHSGLLPWLRHLVRRPIWAWGASLLAVAGICQAGALAAGPLSVVQPVMTTELLFTLVLGSAVFHGRPDPHTWWAFLAMAAGLAVFLRVAHPTDGNPGVPPLRWLVVGAAVSAAVVVLVAVSRRLASAPRAAVLGTATALAFACTAAMMKDAIGHLSEGLTALLTAWQTYAAAAIGLAGFLLLQATLRAGTLVASQPALTLGDSFLSVVLGWVLFNENIALGARIFPEALALGVLVLGSIQLARSPAVSGRAGEAMW